MNVRTAAAVAVATVAIVALPVAFGGSARANNSFSHWGERSLTVSDRTGDPAWQAATHRAVQTWNAVGADVHVHWVEGGVGCEPEGTIIPVCRAALARGTAATTSVYEYRGHVAGARIRVASERAFTEFERDSATCHELGHALGLGHSDSTASCLTKRVTSATPDAHDADTLRSAYAHQR